MLFVRIDSDRRSSMSGVHLDGVQSFAWSPDEVAREALHAGGRGHLVTAMPGKVNSFRGHEPYANVSDHAAVVTARLPW